MGHAALDGDADRALLVDERGELFDGDDVMAAMGLRMAEAGRLAGGAVVVTVMSNLGLELALDVSHSEIFKVPL